MSQTRMKFFGLRSRTRRFLKANKILKWSLKINYFKSNFGLDVSLAKLNELELEKESNLIQESIQTKIKYAFFLNNVLIGFKWSIKIIITRECDEYRDLMEKTEQKFNKEVEDIIQSCPKLTELKSYLNSLKEKSI